MVIGIRISGDDSNHNHVYLVGKHSINNLQNPDSIEQAPTSQIGRRRVGGHHSALERVHAQALGCWA